MFLAAERAFFHLRLVYLEDTPAYHRHTVYRRIESSNARAGYTVCAGMKETISGIVLIAHFVIKNSPDSKKAESQHPIRELLSA